MVKCVSGKSEELHGALRCTPIPSDGGLSQATSVYVRSARFVSQAILLYNIRFPRSRLHHCRYQNRFKPFGKYKRNHANALANVRLLLCLGFYLCVTFIQLDIFMKTDTIILCKNAIETRTVRMACGSSTTLCCMIEGCEWPFVLRTHYIAQCHYIAFEIRNGQTSIETFIEHEEIHKHKHP